MIIDSHAHFEPRMLTEADLLQKINESGVNKVALIPAMNDPLPHTPELLLSIMRVIMQNGFTRPLADLVHRFTLSKDGNLVLEGQEYGIYPFPDNQAVASLVEKYPDTFLGWIFLNPKNNSKVLDDLEKWRSIKGMIGVKLHPHWHDYSVDLLWPVFARCQELNLPVLIHLGFGQNGNFQAILEHFPNLKMIAAHAGFPFYQDLWKFSKDYPNLHVDLSSPYIDEHLASLSIKHMGAERCLYGTDSPYGFQDDNQSYDYNEIKNWILRNNLTDNENKAIFSENFLRLTS